MDFTYNKVKEIIQDKGYAFFEGDYNINLIGVRKANELTNKFDDTFLILYTKGSIKFVLEFDKFTTDPGFFYSKEKLLNEKGVFIMAPGQFRGLWTFGKHRGKYLAGIQVGTVKGYRDRNRDEIIDTNSTTKGIYGINLHHAYASKYINRYSAGCQVFQNKSDLVETLALMKKSSALYGNKFTYTLLEEKDFV